MTVQSDMDFESISAEVDSLVREQIIKEEYDLRMEFERKKLKRKYS
jgi:hypothetical protein